LYRSGVAGFSSRKPGRFPAAGRHSTQNTRWRAA
jgi:hypothetical protein